MIPQDDSKYRIKKTLIAFIDSLCGYMEHKRTRKHEHLYFRKGRSKINHLPILLHAKTVGSNSKSFPDNISTLPWFQAFPRALVFKSYTRWFLQDHSLFFKETSCLVFVHHTSEIPQWNCLTYADALWTWLWSNDVGEAASATAIWALEKRVDFVLESLGLRENKPERGIEDARINLESLQKSRCKMFQRIEEHAAHFEYGGSSSSCDRLESSKRNHWQGDSHPDAQWDLVSRNPACKEKQYGCNSHIIQRCLLLHPVYGPVDCLCQEAQIWLVWYQHRTSRNWVSYPPLAQTSSNIWPSQFWVWICHILWWRYCAVASRAHNRRFCADGTSPHPTLDIPGFVLGCYKNKCRFVNCAKRNMVPGNA